MGEWMSTIELSHPHRQDLPTRQVFILPHVLGDSAIFDALNNSLVGNATKSNVPGPFFTDDTPDGQFNLRLRHITSPSFSFNLRISCPSRPQSRSENRSRRKANESKMDVERRVLTLGGDPIPGTVIETWEMDDKVSSNIRFSSVSSLLTSQTVMRFFLLCKATTTLSTLNAPHGRTRLPR
jgi:hypothetical protein